MTIAAIDFQMLANAGYPPTRFAAGDVIFSEGDKGDVMYVVRSGEVSIEHQGHVMETLGGGGIFGEMALIDGSPRSATVRANTDCEVVSITEKTFLFLVHETPYFAIAVMRALAGRLRHIKKFSASSGSVPKRPLWVISGHNGPFASRPQRGDA
jgi:CRP/FNR family cyclic AMP-dependent transcriptional regulator